ncbi:MAG: asparagine synthetase A [Candidatus Woesearchaeota archaeon]
MESETIEDGRCLTTIKDELDSFIDHLRETRKVLDLQTIILKEIVEFFDSKGFYQLMPVILSTVTDPVIADPTSPLTPTSPLDVYGQKLRLTQSMILHKQAAMISGAKKIFIISPNVRIEDVSKQYTGRHCFEFSQVDFEIAYAKREDVFDFMEEFIVSLFTKLNKDHSDLLAIHGRTLKIPKRPFKKYTAQELQEKYSGDWVIEASKASDEPFWLLDDVSEFYNKEDPNNPGHHFNYDLIYPEGFGEALSGGERETDYDVIVRKLSKKPEMLKQYEIFIELAKRKLLVPSAGAGFGVERLIRFVTGKKHIKDVQFFPRIPGQKVFM